MAATLCTLGLVTAPETTAAQVLAPRQAELLAGRPDQCPVMPIATSAPPAGGPSVDVLLSEGSEAAILGDLERARELLRQAVALDPRHSIASYRLARTLDESGAADAALEEYCRYLTLAPGSVEVEEIRVRVAELVGAGANLPEDPWAAALGEGLTHYEAGRFDRAIGAFSSALATRPRSPDALYNRAAAHLAAGFRAQAIDDFRAYLSAAGDAPDRAEVEARIQALAAERDAQTAAPLATMPQPGSALVQGLIVPGLGQYATGRTFLGVAVLGSAATAVFLGTRSEVVRRVRTGTDPFGNPYDYEVSVLEHPYRVPGFVGAVAIAVAGAVESYLYSNRHQRPTSAVAGWGGAAPLPVPAVDFDPVAGSLRLGFRVKP